MKVYLDLPFDGFYERDESVCINVFETKPKRSQDECKEKEKKAERVCKRR